MKLRRVIQDAGDVELMTLRGSRRRMISASGPDLVALPGWE